jgi:glucuronosyltransferase
MTTSAMKLLAIFYVFINISLCINAAKILGVYTTFSKSHLLVGQNLFKNLAKRGHEVILANKKTINSFENNSFLFIQVTVVSPFPLDPPLKNYRDVTVPITVDHTSLINSFVENSANMIEFLRTQDQLMAMTMNLANDSINTPQFKKLMQDEKFDAIILGFFINDFQVGML